MTPLFRRVFQKAAAGLDKAALTRPAMDIFTSDWHVGHVRALFPPAWVGEYGIERANIYQEWLWTRWCEFWQHVDQRLAELGGRKNVDLALWLVGDLTDNRHHDIVELCLTESDDQELVAVKILDDLQARYKFQERHFIRGTSAHSGSTGESENRIAKMVGNPPLVDGAAYYADYEISVQRGPFLFEAAHEVGNALRPWTWGANIQRELAMVIHDKAIHNEQRPHLSVRGHLHGVCDTGWTYPDSRAITLPPWCLPSAWVLRKRLRGRKVEVGALIATTRPGEPDFELELFRREAPRQTLLRPDNGGQ